jgi:hypothetical protein
MLAGAVEIMDRIMAHPCAIFFTQAIDPEQFPDYYRRIPDPLDLTLIKERLQKGTYRSFAQWAHDMKRVRDNTIKFFGAQSPQGTLVNYLLRLFDKEYEYCTGPSIARWTRLYSSLNNRLLRKLSHFPEPYGTIAAVSLAFKHSIPRPLAIPGCEEPEPEVSPLIEEQNHFLDAIGLLTAREARGLIQIIRKFQPEADSGATNFEVEIDSLTRPCFEALVEHVQKRFRVLGLVYPS